VAQELCQRLGSNAYLAGSIAALGTTYVVGLDAVNCQTGEALAREQARAGSEEHVLEALDQAARSRNTTSDSDIPILKEAKRSTRSRNNESGSGRLCRKDDYIISVVRRSSSQQCSCSSLQHSALRHRRWLRQAADRRG
jgi:hypothetical protein